MGVTYNSLGLEWRSYEVSFPPLEAILILSVVYRVRP